MSPDQDRMAAAIFERVSRAIPITALTCTVRPMGRNIVVSLILQDGDNWIARTIVEGGTNDIRCRWAAADLMDGLCLLLVHTEHESDTEFDIRDDKECQGR